MKKDIEIPKVVDVYVAIVYEYNTIYKTQDWNAYIINNTETDLETLLIVSEGYTDTKITSKMRRKLDVLPKKSYAKIELMQEPLFEMNNTFKVSFFKNNTLFDKTYLFKKHTVALQALQDVPLMEAKGVLAV